MDHLALWMLEEEMAQSTRSPWLDQLQTLHEQGQIDEQIYQREHELSQQATPQTHQADVFLTGGDIHGPATISADAVRLLPGQCIAERYDVIALLGEGGMGQVYLVHDRERERPIALKWLHPTFGEAQQLTLIRQELAINERLMHPHIVRTYSLQRERTNNRRFITMEVVPGTSLQRQISSWSDNTGQWQPPPREQRIRILRQIAGAIQHAHNQGIIHRDLKPANILVTPEHNAKLLDFGIARDLNDTHTPQARVGTAYYMAPEQLNGDTLTPAVDIYALGVIAFQILTGQLPQPGMPGPSVLDTTLPPSIDSVFQQALHWQPAKRYTQPLTFIDALEQVFIQELHKPTRSTPHPDKQSPKTPKTTQKPKITDEPSPQAMTPQWDDQAALDMISLRERHWDVLRKRIDRKRPTWLPEHTRNMPVVGRLLRAERSTTNGRSWPSLVAAPSEIKQAIVFSRTGRPLMPLSYIPAGHFTMGARADDREASRYEQPAKDVSVEAFWVARVPVTNRMWSIFVEESQYKTSPSQRNYLNHWRGDTCPAALADRPVVWVSYEDVWAFCDFYGLSLPSEAQWEKMAGGLDGRLYPWGEEAPSRTHGNFGMLEGGVTQVGHCPEGMSPFGVLDCAGNVYEWCADGWNPRYFQEVEGDDPVHMANRGKRVTVRGGHYNTKASFLRVSYRYGLQANQNSAHCGFRPVLDIRT